MSTSRSRSPTPGRAEPSISAGDEARPSRRRLLAAATGLAAAGVVARSGDAGTGSPAPGDDRAEPHHGRHQPGILTAAQPNTYLAGFDLTAPTRHALIDLLRSWTMTAARLTGETPAGLTVTFGFGTGLFAKEGEDRYGLAARRPAALVELPAFEGDELIEARTGGDLSVQACADTPEAAFAAVRHLAHAAHGAAAIRWAQTGFITRGPGGGAARNLMGFKDGTGNPPVEDAAAMERHVWVGDEGPDWMRGGSYVVFRRIRIALEHWERMPIDFQEQTFGRHKKSGAPLGGTGENDPVDLGAVDAAGEPMIPDSAHIRLAAAANNEGARILRRAYSYNDGVDFTVERWPPWHRGLEYDAGLLFVCYQRDPRSGFIRIYDKLAKFDMLSQFVTHTGGGLFACPGGAMPGEFIGQRLFTET